MSAIVPPLDFIPKLPSVAVTETIKQINTQTDVLLQTVTKTVTDSIKLPGNCKCDDPRMKKIKEQLAQVQEQIAQIQATIPKVQTTINTVKQIVNIAIGIKSAISAAQLSNPTTAAVFIATQLTLIQDATIVNALESLKQFEQVPNTLVSKVQTVIPPILSALQRVESACGDDTDSVEIPADFLRDGNVTDYNDLVETDFYTEDNVNDKDISDRSDLIQDILKRQQDLLTSLQEAPSVVYQGTGLPVNSIGKPGDYYIDQNTQIVYGPKVSYTSWT